MTGSKRLSTATLVVTVAAIAAALAAGVTYAIVTRRQPAAVVAPPSASTATTTSDAPARITLSPDVQARAGIKIGAAVAGSSSAQLHVPGHIEANAYRLTTVTATTAGRATSVAAELGMTVTRGQSLAQLFAPEVADQQRVYLSMQSELEAAHAKLTRTEKLVALGSVSQQELEATRAEHTTHATDVEGARAKLILLGLSPERVDRLRSAADIVATVDVVSPSNGVITERKVNTGLNVQAGAELFTVADLSDVWAVADVFERDLPQIRVGTNVSISSPADAGDRWRSTVSYVDPQVSPTTRTVRIRAVVQNPQQRLKLGEYVDVAIEGATGSVVTLPKSAVQTIADRQFVYVPDAGQPNVFVEREVRTGATNGEAVEIVSGVRAGESVVTDGSFYIRAERDRLGLPLPAKTEPQTDVSKPVREIAVTERGFEPDRVTVPPDVPIELRFTRKTDTTCAKAVTIPSLNVKKDLPLNVSVAVSLPPQHAGNLQFSCGMNMLSGTVVVR